MKIFEDIDRMLHEQLLVDRVVFDLDKIIAEAGDNYSGTKSNLSNRDELRWEIVFELSLLSTNDFVASVLPNFWRSGLTEEEEEKEESIQRPSPLMFQIHKEY